MRVVIDTNVLVAALRSRNGASYLLVEKWRPQLPDADDEIVLDAALNGKARAIVTFNRSDFAAAARRFGIEVISPIDLLRSCP